MIVSLAKSSVQLCRGFFGHWAILRKVNVKIGMSFIDCDALWVKCEHS